MCAADGAVVINKNTHIVNVWMEQNMFVSFQLACVYTVFIS